MTPSPVLWCRMHPAPTVIIRGKLTLSDDEVRPVEYQPSPEMAQTPHQRRPTEDVAGSHPCARTWHIAQAAEHVARGPRSPAVHEPHQRRSHHQTGRPPALRSDGNEAAWAV